MMWSQQLSLRATSLGVTFALNALAACATAPARPAEPGVPGALAAPREPALPPIPHADGPLRLEVGYPPQNAALAVRDSNFIFGSTGSGRSQLTINGTAVDVAANGGFLAFLPVPADGVYRLNATQDGETTALERSVRVPAAPGAPTAAARILSPYPTGAWALRAGETFEVGLRGPAGAQASLLLPDGSRIPLVEQGAVAESAVGDEFRTSVPAQPRAPATSRYSAVIPVTAPFMARDTGLVRPRIGMLDMAPRPGGVTARDAVLELVAGNDTARAPLRLNLAVLAPDVPRTGVVLQPPDAAHDWTARGRNDVSGPFHYFWPPGARLTITGEKDGNYRVRLAGNRHAWVSAGDVRLLPAGAPPAAGIVNAVRFAPQPQWIDLRIPATERLPFFVTEEEDVLHIDVFGATSRVNFFQYGGLDPLITRAAWSQPADSVFRVTVQLSAPVWGYQTFYEPGGALVLRIRRPPPIDAAAPLRGLIIAVDAGHGGEDRATRGPTGLAEADANLYIALELRALLQQAGARVVMTRTTDATVPLADRPRLAADSGAHILVSVHNNAFPDGVNPWVNNGTSAYYFHPHSAELARLFQHELLQELALRDIGYGRADLALARPTWMPAALTETMFLMIPQQEAALRDPAVHRRIARAHLRALEAFVLRRARR
jgi:N-acetylmuramoyl-L-alanine amidase